MIMSRIHPCALILVTALATGCGGGGGGEDTRLDNWTDSNGQGDQSGQEPDSSVSQDASESSVQSSRETQEPDNSTGTASSEGATSAFSDSSVSLASSAGSSSAQGAGTGSSNHSSVQSSRSPGQRSSQSQSSSHSSSQTSSTNSAQSSSVSSDQSSSQSSDQSSSQSSDSVGANDCSVDEPLKSVTVAFEQTPDQQYEAPAVEDSFGECAPPDGTEFADNSYAPRWENECSVATHDRYWVRAHDGEVYRTWHPASTIDVETGEPCQFGHEHGDDPRESPLYEWAGGVPFGMVYSVAEHHGMQRHEDHYGHKVYVQNHYQAAVGNGANADPIAPAGFHCYWLSKIHQGTHSGDALAHNMHEYHHNLMCNDGLVRQPTRDFGANTGPDHHTADAVKTLTFWGQPGAFKACKNYTLTATSDNPAEEGAEPPENSDTNREIECAYDRQAWPWKDFPEPVTSPSGHVDYAPDDAGITEIWKPWMTVTSRDGQQLFHTSPYYGVLDPIRLYNGVEAVDGATPLVAQDDFNGDGQADNWIPTLEACLRADITTGVCARIDVDAFPDSVPRDQWWQHPASPFKGALRFVHQKKVTLSNASQRSGFCTDHLGHETEHDPQPDEQGIPRCPAGSIYQKVATTQNLWFINGARWGENADLEGAIRATMINADPDSTPEGYSEAWVEPAGFRHEWVRFIDEPGVRAPN